MLMNRKIAWRKNREKKRDLNSKLNIFVKKTPFAPIWLLIVFISKREQKRAINHSTSKFKIFSCKIRVLSF